MQVLTYESLIIFTKRLNDNNIKLANFMQNLEADIVLNVIPKCPYYTVHDAIYLTNLTEINEVQNRLLQIICDRSGDKIKKISFGDIDLSKREVVKKNLEKFKSIDISDKERKEHSAMKNRYNRFVELYDKMNQEQICETLDISRMTYFNYKKKIKIK